MARTVRPEGERRLRPIEHVWLLLLLPAVYLCVFFAEGAVIDDAFISFRYAENWLAGHGLVFNPGDRVEGYTNFLWVALLAATAAIGVDIRVASQALGAGFALATLVVIARFWSDDRGQLRWTRALAGFLLVCNMGYWMWALHGLETAMFGFWVTMALREDCRARQQDAAPRLSALYYALATLTRPEGALLFCISAVFWISISWRRTRLLLVLPHLVVYAGIVGTHLAWRYTYYGDLVPNTAHAKLGLSQAVLDRGLDYVIGFFAHPGALIYALCLFPLATLRRESGPLLLLLAVVASLTATAVEGGDAFVAWRFLAPIAPALYVLTATGAARVLESPFGSRHPALTSIALALGVALAGAAQVSHTRPSALAEKRGAHGFEEMLRLSADALSEAFPRTTTMALNPVGALPYYTGFRTIDMLGLTDRHIARSSSVDIGHGHSGHEKGDGRYILDQRPDLIMLGNVRILRHRPSSARPLRFRPYHRSEKELMRIPELWNLYVTETLPLADGRILAFLRRRDFLRPERQ